MSIANLVFVRAYKAIYDVFFIISQLRPVESRYSPIVPASVQQFENGCDNFYKDKRQTRKSYKLGGDERNSNTQGGD